ncbi:outer membrane protein transport protein, partial [Pseudomonas aeruginosa]
GYRRDSDSDQARYQGREVSLQRLTYFSPTLAYQVNDELSVGLSVGFSHQAVALNEDFRAPNQLLGLLQQTRENGCLPGMQEIL